MTIALGIGASHSTLMNTDWAHAKNRAGPANFRHGLEAACTILSNANVDALVVIGSNHFRGIFLDLMPSFCVGVGEVHSAGEAGTPQGQLKTDPAFALGITEFMVREGFDMAFSLRLQIDHGITHTYQHLVPQLDVPIVPIIINTFAPPLPSLKRCISFGSTLGNAIRALSVHRRIAIVASGGLSHRLPWPKWYEALSDDEKFLVGAWLNGRGTWKEFEKRRRDIVRGATASINSDFDRQFLKAILSGDLDYYEELSSSDLEMTAGNGAHEIRAWLAMAAAVHARRGRILAYEPIPEWLTGMAVLVLEPEANSEAS